MSSSITNRYERRLGRVERAKHKELGPKTRRKKVYRLRAHDAKGRLVLTKTRTKQPMATIKRIATLKGLIVDRVT